MLVWIIPDILITAFSFVANHSVPAFFAGRVTAIALVGQHLCQNTYGHHSTSFSLLTLSFSKYTISLRILLKNVGHVLDLALDIEMKPFTSLFKRMMKMSTRQGW
jgi:hypothetical protein